jgi:ribosomal protein L2
MFTINQPVTIECGDGQHLTRSVGERATVVKLLGAFVLVKLENGDIRGCLPFYLQPMVTAASFER